MYDDKEQNMYMLGCVLFSVMWEMWQLVNYEFEKLEVLADVMVNL